MLDELANSSNLRAVIGLTATPRPTAPRARASLRKRFGDTPLIAACAKGNVSSAALLIQRGADATIQDQEGRTAKERSAPDTAPCRSLPK